MGTRFHLKFLRFPSVEVKALSKYSHVLDKNMRRYAQQNEVRFKVTDKQKEIYIETASYLYENNKMDKSNIQSFGRWCMDYVCQIYRLSVLESKAMKQLQQRPNQMQQSPQLSYPPYYTSDHAGLF